MKNNLPKYKITIDDEYSEGENLGISMIAFTSKPAIITKGMAFNVDEPKNLFFADELKYRICAPVMVPMEIYRCDSNEEYFVQFTEQEIDAIHQKFMSNLTNTNIFNLEHNSDNVMPAFVLEAWIVDTPETDKAFQTYGIKVPKGTLMMTTQITDKQVYSNLVKSGQVGYSIEGFLGLKLSEIKMSENPPYHENCKCEEVNGEIVSEPGVCDYCLEQQSKFEIDKKNNKQIMKEDKIPAGEYQTPDGKVLVVAEDGTFTIKETVKEEMGAKPKEEIALEVDPKDETAVDNTVIDETKIAETELAVGDEVIAEVPVEEVEVEEVEEVVSYTKEEVDAKLDEIYKMVAELKAEHAQITEEVEVPVETYLSINERFEAFNRFFTNSKVEL
jgi:hypothetical protein